MDWSKLSTLREMTRTSAEFSSVFAYFFDHLAEDPEFLDDGRRIRHEALEGIVAVVAERCIGAPVRVSGLTLVEVPGRGFIHGMGWLDGRITTLFYFADPGVGMLAVAVDDRGSTKFARFVALGLVSRG